MIPYRIWTVCSLCLELFPSFVLHTPAQLTIALDSSNPWLSLRHSIFDVLRASNNSFSQTHQSLFAFLVCTAGENTVCTAQSTFCGLPLLTLERLISRLTIFF